MSCRLMFFQAVVCFSSIALFEPLRCPAQLLQGTINGNVTDPSGAQSPAPRFE